MNFLWFSVLAFMSVSLFVGLAIGLSYRKGKKKLSFVVFIGYILCLIAVFLTEFGIYLWQEDNTVNPSHPWTGYTRPAKHPNLQYLRLPNIRWQEKTHGDLASLNFDRDPYAREVTYYTDSEGFRNHRDIRQADLIAVGDSYTEAGTVQEAESYLVRVGEMVQLTTKNLGVSGYNTPYASIILGEYGLKLNPKVAIIQIAESNDLSENKTYYDWVKAGKPKVEFDPIVMTRYDVWKLRSPMYALYQKLFPLHLSPYRIQGTFKDENGKSYLTRFFQAPNSKMKPQGNIGWEVMIGSLFRMKELCEENNIIPIVLLIPDKMTVMHDFVDFEPQTQEILAQHPPIEPQESLGFYLARQCEELQMNFVDATPALYEAAKTGKLVYLPMDTHLSPQGHHIVAEELAKLFKQR